MFSKLRIFIDHEGVERLMNVEQWSTETKAALYAVRLMLGIKSELTPDQTSRMYEIGILLESLQHD